jgi:hypothetical protein
MIIIEKVIKKLKRIYYDYKLNTIKRTEFNENTYYKSIKDETSKCNFNKPIFLLSYDDTSMMKESAHTFDFGGDIEGEVNKLFFDFVKKYSYLKHTLFFVPNPNFIKTGLTSKTIKNDIYNIDNFSIKDGFLLKLKELEKKNIIEISLHGYNHINIKIKDYYSAFEFEFLSNTEASEKISRGLKGLEKFFKIDGFKPPAWGMGQLNGKYYLKDTLSNFTFNYVCLSSPSNGLNYKKQQVSLIYPENIDGLFNIPQNISILWELDYIYMIIDLIVEKKGIINIQLHYTVSHALLTDGICKKNIEKLSKIVEYIKQYDIDYLLHREVKEKCKK